MKRELNLQCLYKVVFDTEIDLYIFHTINGIEYRVAFEKVEYISINNLYSISVVAVGSEYPPMDMETNKAIREIVKYFFQDEQKVMIYLCDSNDEKGILRHRKFNSWFEKDDFNKHLIKLDGIIDSDGELFFTSIICHKNNIAKNDIEVIYKESITELSSK